MFFMLLYVAVGVFNCYTYRNILLDWRSTLHITNAFLLFWCCWLPVANLVILLIGLYVFGIKKHHDSLYGRGR